MLKSQNALDNDKNSARASELVGDKSFTFEKALGNSTRSETYGIIKGISPMFLVNNNVWYVKTPYDHKPKTGDRFNSVYTPFQMSESPRITYGNSISLYPCDYNAKDGYGGGYISLSDLTVVREEDILMTSTRVGINSHRTEEYYGSGGVEEAYFKRECFMLRSGYKFAFTADIGDNIFKDYYDTVVFMGQNKSPFHCRAEKCDISFDTAVENAFKKIERERTVMYAASDIVPLGEYFDRSKSTDYYIADTRVMRSLETVKNADSYYNRLKKSKTLYKVINAGSVFYTNDKGIFANKGLETIGMNKLIEI